MADLTKDQAKDLVARTIQDPSVCRHDAVVLDRYTIEKPWGWVFFYNSREFAETGDTMTQLVGNAPYIVNRHTGEVLITGTAQSIEH